MSLRAQVSEHQRYVLLALACWQVQTKSAVQRRVQTTFLHADCTVMHAWCALDPCRLEGCPQITGCSQRLPALALQLMLNMTW